MKLKVKKLIKPITKVIDIQIYTWWDKTNGNTYCSARTTINFDYDNIIYTPCHNNSTGQVERNILKYISVNYRGLSEVYNMFYHECLKHGISLQISTNNVKYRECVRFGKP